MKYPAIIVEQDPVVAAFKAAMFISGTNLVPVAGKLWRPGRPPLHLRAMKSWRIILNSIRIWIFIRADFSLWQGEVPQACWWQVKEFQRSHSGKDAVGLALFYLSLV